MAAHAARLARAGAGRGCAAHAIDAIAGRAGRGGAGGATLAIAQAGYAVFPGFIHGGAVRIAAKKDHHGPCAVKGHGKAVTRAG